jgi:hypothetical protein
VPTASEFAVHLVQLAAARTTGWTASAALLYFHGMARRRSVHDPLQATVAARWYVVRSMHGSIIETRELPPGVDLKRAFVAAMLHWLDAGWHLGEFSSASGAFFCERDSERRMISIDPADPHGMPMYGASHLGGGT